MTVIPLVTFDGVNGGTILNIGKGGGVVQRRPPDFFGIWNVV